MLGWTCPKIAHPGLVTQRLRTGPDTVVHVSFSLKFGQELFSAPGSQADDSSMVMMSIVNPIVLFQIKTVTEPNGANGALEPGVPLAVVNL